ncbi:MAG: hypothetical protein QOF01_1064, partial [Thermomicrobiales bacterium]|nr:hypothetical protein [Thermomicrobiales bacterium]
MAGAVALFPGVVLGGTAGGDAWWTPG